MQINVTDANWMDDAEAIRGIRHDVFVVEQKVEPELEWDGKDADCLHALARDASGQPVATGRLATDGKIGRMAVRLEARGQGIGAAILDHLIGRAVAAGLPRVYLHAQTQALAFYARHGFVAHGPEFDEADIPHRLMTLELDPTPAT